MARKKGLSEEERRVLGHLPPWWSDEEAEAKRANELELNGDCIRDYPLEAMQGRLAADVAVGVNAPPENQLSSEDVEQVLIELQERGLVSDSGGRWRMLKAGLEAL